MPTIETAGMGTVEILDEQIIEFHEGLPGFPDVHRFVLLDIEDLPFRYLQSLDQQSLAFVVADPFAFFPKYSFDLSESDLDKLEADSPESLAVYGIVTLHDNVDLSTMNLVAPVVIHVEKKQGRQMILSTTSYTTKHQIFSASNE